MDRVQKRNYDQYITRYAEPEARVLRSVLLSNSSFLPEIRSFASIPLCREREQIAGCLAALKLASFAYPAIVIFVVNNRVSAEDTLKRDNEETSAFLLSQLAETTTFENMTFGHVNPNLSLLVVDRTSPGWELPEDQGVGLARKIGCDLASVMMCESKASDGFIRTTDGDARVADDYFLPMPIGPAAAIFPFRHEAKGDGVNAVLQYEEYLHYYVRAMAAAGSSYAFHTIGSTIACSVKSYISCRGFPKKDAGEDFYLLNKLAKDGDVVMLKRSPITLVARDSDRVPFGTGAACRRIEGLVASGGVYKVYHPDCFLLLKLWLEAVSELLELWTEKSVNLKAAGTVANAWQKFSLTVQDAFPGAPHTFVSHLDTQLGLQAGLESVLSKSSKLAVLVQHSRIWFDGFRTMRFLNLARDHCFGDIPATELKGYFASQIP